MTSQRVKVFEGIAHYAEYGNGSHAILCLHGNSSSSDAFARFANGLPPAFRLICVDFPGHGQSDGADRYKGLFSFQGLATFVVELLKVLSISPVAIVGHSMGGHVAAQLLPKLPTLQALLLISSPPIAGATSLPQFFRNDAPTGLIFAKTLTEDQVRELSLAFTHVNALADTLALVESDIRRADGAFREELGESLSDGEVEDELAIVKSVSNVEIALLGGLKDRFIERGYYGWVAEQIGLDRQDSLVIDNVGHYPHIEAPQMTREFFRRFLKRINISSTLSA